MPLSESEVDEVRYRLFCMYMDTIETFRKISENAEIYFGDNSTELTDAISEYTHDFIDDADGEERIHPEALIFRTDRVALQSAGFYGFQLNLKERQVTAVNVNLRAAIAQRVRGVFNAPFKKWVGVINNFLGSLEITGVGSALKEIKDCLRDELPDE